MAADHAPTPCWQSAGIRVEAYPQARPLPRSSPGVDVADEQVLASREPNAVIGEPRRSDAWVRRENTFENIHVVRRVQSVPTRGRTLAL